LDHWQNIQVEVVAQAQFGQRVKNLRLAQTTQICLHPSKSPGAAKKAGASGLEEKILNPLMRL
jgi:hypothetical protein